MNKLRSESTQVWRINVYLSTNWLWHIQELNSTTYRFIMTFIIWEQMWPWENVTVRFCRYYLSCADMLVGGVGSVLWSYLLYSNLKRRRWLTTQYIAYLFETQHTSTAMWPLSDHSVIKLFYTQVFQETGWRAKTS